MIKFNKYKVCLFCLTIILMVSANDCQAQREDHFIGNDAYAPFTPGKNLEKSFQNPPAQAKPWAFWWWLEGNIDEAGIRKDLAAMKAVGISGAIIFNAGSSSYTDVERTPPGPVFMSSRFRQLFKDAVKVADSLHILISMNIGSGWNDGGPWVTPEYAAKKLVWSELKVTGPVQLNQTLPLPSNVFSLGGDARPYFKPVATLAIRLGDSSVRVTPLEYFNQKAVHNVNIPQTPDGYNWNIFLQEDTSTLNQYDAKLKDIINISGQVDSAGNIHWSVPPGNYVILRFGYTCTGARVSTGSPGGGGLAIDYMDAQAMDLQFNKVPGVLIKDISLQKGGALKYLYDDSWELGAANWTSGFMKDFKQQHGYDIIPYLPVIAGWIIDNKDISNRFLFDFRRTIGNLIAKNHYQHFRELAHEHGLGIHSEAGGPHPAPIDALKNMGIDDMPQGEFWAKVNTHRVKDYERIFVKQGASAAHIYGRRYVQDEGPTSIGPQWEMDPVHLKPTIDRAFCEGMNRIVFHTFTHSPESVGKPGYEYFAGTHFNPNITWWKQAPAYVNYITRCQFMLQQGAFVGDVCFYYGDNVPAQVHLKRIDPSLGEGYDYDWIDTQILLDSMNVKNNRIYLNNGMHYEVLVLPDQTTIPLPVLNKIKQLVNDGATVIGPRPESSAGLSGYPAANTAVEKTGDELWGNIDGKIVTSHRYGKGEVIWGKTIRAVLHERGVIPDFIAEGKKQLQDVDYIHRHYKDYDIYFVCNLRDTAQWFTADFRATDESPSLWFPDDGKIIPQQVFTTHDTYTSLPLYLPSHGSVFVVFKSDHENPHIDTIQYNNKIIYPFKPDEKEDSLYFVSMGGNNLMVNRTGRYILHSSDDRLKQIAVSVPVPDTIKGRWEVHFDTAWGGPGNVTFGKLISWTKSADKGIKYYSGTAVYKNTFKLRAGEINKNCLIQLDLGILYNVATVKINGQYAGILWKKPFTVDASPYVKEGINNIEIKVVNLWPNRIIGDQFLPPGKRYTHTNVIKFTKDYPLPSSGLLGPVVIEYKPLISVN